MLIKDVFEEFLSEQESRLSPKTYRGYASVIELFEHQLDAYGGPDAAHESFTPVQKAISYAMTSPFTTGGIRGNAKHIGQFLGQHIAENP